MTIYYVTVTANGADKPEWKLGPFATEAHARRCARANDKSGWYVVRIISQVGAV